MKGWVYQHEVFKACFFSQLYSCHVFWFPYRGYYSGFSQWWSKKLDGWSLPWASFIYIFFPVKLRDRAVTWLKPGGRSTEEEIINLAVDFHFDMHPHQSEWGIYPLSDDNLGCLRPQIVVKWEQLWQLNYWYPDTSHFQVGEVNHDLQDQKTHVQKAW